MKYSITILLLLLAEMLAGCKEDRNGSGTIDSASATTPNTGSAGNNDSTGLEPPDTNGGEQCTEDWAVYQCRGLILPLYRYGNGGAGNPVFWENIDDPDGLNNPLHGSDPYICSDTIFITAPAEVVPDNQMLFDACKAKCEEEKGDLVFASDIGPYKFKGDVECIFEPDAHDGKPHTMPYGAGQTKAHCDWIDAEDPQQVLWDRPATAQDCESLDCTTWQPTAFIGYSYNSSTRTHTTTMPAWFMDEMDAEQGGRLYACDEGRFVWGFSSSGAPYGKMATIGPGEVLYRMGFRNGDYALTVQRAGSPTYPIFPLDSPFQRADAWAALHTYSSFVVKFRRPGLAGTYAAHTMNLTLPAL